MTAAFWRAAFRRLAGPAVLAVTLASPAAAQDLDNDGIPDGLEQALLERFVPTLVLSAGECDSRPASFAPDRRDPIVLARDGTLYGHVALHSATPAAVTLELKYFHLWSRDCGRPSHALDVEHVAALVQAPSLDSALDAWRAEAWYAAAHEGTVCDASSGAAAAAIRAEHGGPYVYVSRGKHASYLARGHCKWGCGSDLCDPGPAPLRPVVVNLGERDAPLNGATWLASKRWSLGGKLGPDFSSRLRATLDGGSGHHVLALRLRLRTIQAPILGGDTGLDALIAAGDAAVLALDETVDATGQAVKAVGGAVGKAARGTAKTIRRILRLR